MPAIVAYSGPPNTDPDTERKLLRAGMQFLGGELLNATTKQNVKSEAKKAKGVEMALNKVINEAGYELRFQTKDNSQNDERGFKVTSVTSSGNSVECALENDQGNSMGILILEVKLDTVRDLTGRPEYHEYYMRVSFPERKDDDGSDYLVEIAAHLKEIVNSTTSPTPFDDARNFLAAFKFLSRCK